MYELETPEAPDDRDAIIDLMRQREENLLAMLRTRDAQVTLQEEISAGYKQLANNHEELYIKQQLLLEKYQELHTKQQRLLDISNSLNEGAHKLATKSVNVLLGLNILWFVIFCAQVFFN